MARTVTPRLEQDAYDELREAAAAERRPLSDFIATAALERVREAQFVDDGEMAEIVNDDALVRSLRIGPGRLADARATSSREHDRIGLERNMREVTTTEATARFAELLREVEYGELIAITRHGKTVARLIPAVDHGRASREGAVERFRAWRRQRPRTGMTREEILAARHEGHHR